MVRRTLILAALAAAAFAQQPGMGIQRSMSLLAGSTPERRNTVKILFYGQSITKQNWWKLVAADLRRRFPYADLHASNRAIGGFAAPMLKRVMVHDIASFAPDLIILHDYGAESDYEEIIRYIRSNTTAELALQTDHVTWLPPAAAQPPSDPAMKSYLWHEQHCGQWMPAIARKYGAAVIDVRTPWKAYLASQGLEPKDLLSDTVHLNARGDQLMADLVAQALVRVPSIPAEATVNDHKPAWSNGRLKLEFQGNRVDLAASRSARQPYSRARVLIDGKPPSQHPELYFITRPSDSAAVDWPFVIRIDHRSPLLVEDWFLTIAETNADNSVVRFTVRGSVTGEDGAGSSDALFISKSGRVVIAPEDWHLKRAFDLRKQLTPAGAVCRWKVVPLFLDTYEPPLVDDRTREYAVTLANGLANGRHTLELIAETPETPLLESIRTFRPPVPDGDTPR